MVLTASPQRQRAGNKGHGQVKAKMTKWAMATATRMASNNKGDGNPNEGGGRATAIRAMIATVTL